MKPVVAPRWVVLVGPTAAGKTDLAVEACEQAGVPVEIVVLDSRQLYRGLDLGTGKPDAGQRRRVVHHLLDCLGCEETPDAMDYRRRVEEVTTGIMNRGAVVFLVGGAGFYLRALREGFHELEQEPVEFARVRAELSTQSADELLARLQELDPASAQRLHPNDRYRVGRALELCLLSGRPASELERDFVPRPVHGAEFMVARLSPPRALLHERIQRRTRKWLDAGWPEEVRGLIASGIGPDSPGLQILGYRQVVALDRGEIGREECEEQIVVATRRYSRSQETWFRKEKAALRMEIQDAAATADLAALLREAAGSS